MSDKQLLKLLNKNPAEGLREVINQYGRLLSVVVSRILKNPQDTEECIADTIVDLWKNIHKLKKSDSLKGYLLCIARNNAINRYNKLKREYSFYSSDSGDLNEEIASDEDVELSVIQKESMEELHKLIMTLSEPNREIFIRKYYLFESVKEIAEKLELTDIQVKDKLYRSRKHIRKLLDKKGEKHENNKLHKTNRQYM
jgi:RNA polymerase sigma-70 factor (ECF subfamily)